MKVFIKTYPPTNNFFPLMDPFANLTICEQKLLDYTQEIILTLKPNANIFLITYGEKIDNFDNDKIILRNNLNLPFLKDLFIGEEKLLFIDLISFLHIDDLKSILYQKKSSILVKKGNPSQYLNYLNNKFYHLGVRIIFKNYFLKKNNEELINSLKNFELYSVISNKSLPLSYPWHYLEANIIRLNELSTQIPKGKIKGTIEKGVVVKGPLFLGENSVIKGHSYIEGPVYIGDNCEIGPFAHIRPETIIEKNCKIGKMELVDTLIRKNVVGKHLGYIGHSIVDENVNIGANLITADYRYDGENHITWINGKKIPSYRSKLGTVIGKNVKTSIGTLIYPGRKIISNSFTLPSETIIRDKIN